MTLPGSDAAAWLRSAISYQIERGVMTRRSGAVIPLARAVLCADCEAIVDVSTTTCPRCTSTTLNNLSRLVNRAPVVFRPSDGGRTR